ncbi:MAG: CDP-alcohol phosphatidyltransferase family protein [Desulfurococcales archaeon]|nr:CDP-alcohol phosphatidyltransferase family protein [Desulfurococcales archaeon]
MLERLRERVRPLTSKAGRALARLTPDPDVYTYAGALTAWLVPLAAAVRPALAPLLLIVSALLDALDGAVARAVGRSSRHGEFLDSFLDRLADTAYYYSLLILGVCAPAVLIAGMFSVIVSYARAKGELVGVKLRGVGLMERGDRVIVILVIMLVALAGYGREACALTWILAVLVGATAAHRAARILGRLS